MRTWSAVSFQQYCSRQSDNAQLGAIEALAPFVQDDCETNLPEMFAVRGMVFSYEAVRDWEAKLTPALAEELQRRRKGRVGRSWHVDET